VVAEPAELANVEKFDYIDPVFADDGLLLHASGIRSLASDEKP